jgi:hypothetical protein
MIPTSYGCPKGENTKSSDEGSERGAGEDVMFSKAKKPHLHETHFKISLDLDL